MAARFPALLPLLLAALQPTFVPTEPPPPPCPWEMNKVKDIVEVNCSGRDLGAVPAGLPEDTGILLLNANRLPSVSTAAFQPLPALQDLDLSDNGLQALHADVPLPSLQELLLSRNALQALPALRFVPALTRLALAHNRLRALPPAAFRAVPGLRDLDLRGNALRTLPEDAFAELRALKDLDLSDNGLEELPAGLLRDLQQLETLWLSGNRLRALPSGFFPEGHLFAYVFLADNPWHCDCGLVYLRSWIHGNQVSVYEAERSLGKVKLEVAPEKVLCLSPPEHRLKPVIRFKPNCGHVGDAEEEDYDDYDEEPAPVTSLVNSSPPTYPPSSKAPTTAPRTPTQPPLTSIIPPLSTFADSSLAPTSSLTTPASTTASNSPPPASAGSTIPSTTQPPSTAPAHTAPPSPPHSPVSLPPAPSTSSHTQSPLPSHTASSPLTTSIAAFPAGPSALPSPTNTEGTSVATSSPAALTSPTPLLPNTTFSIHTPTLSAPLDTTRVPLPSPPLPPPLLCPCSAPAQAPSVLHSQSGVKVLHWEHWVLSRCCLLRWLLYLACLALLLLSVLPLSCCLAWLCLTGQHNPLQPQEMQHPLLRWENSAESHTTHLSIFRSPHQRSTFCTTKEVELRPEATSCTYCTIKDLGVQRSRPAKSFCTTKELWIRHSPLNASPNPFPVELTATKLSSRRSPSAHSLGRGVSAVGVKYAANTL
ncbi:platelet glycoprotein Ib alpha chain [Coturnix japonica]|uniref:Glycoprotein Ib platelet subunit alpha n=1 Tax=Coturnix japonica TaxID=93934 RepID=A0A8C2T107_COTJA|nr:platelet glycoprotein Ib alpha chain [Coturnix japonica]